MKRTPAKRSSLFLLELIIAILFFSLTSVVCVQFFARAHLISRQTQELNAALEKYPVVTEIFLAGGDFTDIFGDRVSCTRSRMVLRITRSATTAAGSFARMLMLLTRCSPDTALRPSAAWLLYGFAPENNTPDEDPVIYSTETDYCPVPGKGGA